MPHVSGVHVQHDDIHLNDRRYLLFNGDYHQDVLNIFGTLKFILPLIKVNTLNNCLHSDSYHTLLYDFTLNRMAKVTQRRLLLIAEFDGRDKIAL